MKAKYLLLIGLIIFSSCWDRSNISVSGKITDESGRPIPNAEVVVLCWYMNSIDDASFEKQILITDKDGNYKATFAKGHQVDVASKTNGHVPSRSYNELEDNKLEVNLKLSPIKSNPTLVTLLSTDSNSSEDTGNTPSIRVRIYACDRALDFDNMETYGFDLKTLSTKADTAECDFWFKIERNDLSPTTIHTHVNGGIIPVYLDEINSSFLFEKPVAPATGYRQQYTLKDNEEGFFVLSRDGKTFGKVILEKSRIERGSPHDWDNGYYKEHVRRFTCLYQPNGTNDLSYSRPDIDLENFLVDYRFE